MAVTNLDSLSVGTADGLLVNNVKVPDRLTIVSKFTASTVPEWLFIADRAWQVIAIRERHSVVGGSAAAVRPRKVTDTSAPGAAASATVKELTTAALDLTAAINANAPGTLSATPSDLQLAVGDAIGLNFTGTLTGVVGVLVITLQAI